MTKSIIKIAICDDDEEIRIHLVDLIQSIAIPENIQIVISVFPLGTDLVQAYENHNSFDLIFLDMLMEGLNGLETALSIRQFDKKSLIVFLTSSPDFALQSYEVEAFDYILKGMNNAKIESIFLKALANIQSREERQISIKSGLSYHSLNCKSIEFIEIYAKKLSINLIPKQKIETYKPIRELEDEIKDMSQFFKIHRSIIVNLLYITQINPKFVITLSGEKLPVARGKFYALKDAFLLYTTHKK